MNMKKFKFKIYPANQIQRYLFIDIILCVFLFYQVLSADSPVGLFGTFLLLALFLVLFYMGLWYRDWRLLAVVVAGCGLMTVFAIFYNQWILLFATVFADFLGRVRSRGHLAALAAIEERMRLLRGEARVGPSAMGGVKVTLAVAVPVQPAAEEAQP